MQEIFYDIYNRDPARLEEIKLHVHNIKSILDNIYRLF